MFRFVVLCFDVNTYIKKKVVSYRQTEINNNLTPKHIVKYVKRYTQYITNQLVSSNTFLLLFTNNTSYMYIRRDLTSVGGLWSFRESFVIV